MHSGQDVVGTLDGLSDGAGEHGGGHAEDGESGDEELGEEHG